MPVDAAFVSSVQRGLERIRAAAAAAVRALGMHAELAEEAPAAATSPQRALLDKVATSDVLLLILGSSYGERGESGFSPTEDEFNEAVRLGKDVLVFVQQTEMELEQAEFLKRVRGTWEDGRLYRSFEDETDIGTAVAAALAELRSGGPGEDPDAAAARAIELARGEPSRGRSSGLHVRVAYAPLRQGTILDAVALEDATLPNDLSQMLRDAGVVPQSIGIEAATSSEGVKLAGGESRDWIRPAAVVYADGTITVSSGIHAEGMLGTSLVDPTRLEQVLAKAGAFARAAWNRIDDRRVVTRIAVTAAIPDASYKGWGSGSNPNQMSPGMQVPETVLAPEPPLVIPSAQASSPETVRRVVAALKRVFSDAGAVQE